MEMGFLRRVEAMFRPRGSHGVAQQQVVQQAVNHEKGDELMEISNYQAELQQARDRVRLVEADHAGAVRKVAELEQRRDRIEADHLEAVAEAIKAGQSEPSAPDPAAIAKEIAMATVRRKAFASVLEEERGKLRQVEAAAVARRRQEFLADAEPAVSAVMDALQALVEKITAAQSICDAHGFQFRELPIDLSAPSGCGGFARPDPLPGARLGALYSMPWLFSQVSGIPKFWNKDDERVAEHERVRREGKERQRLKLEGDAREHESRKRRMALGQFGMVLLPEGDSIAVLGK
jgi:hypothetical protein